MSEEKTSEIVHKWPSKAATLRSLVDKDHQIVQMVRLEAHYPDRSRFLSLIKDNAEHFCLLGIDLSTDCEELRPTLGFVGRFLWNTQVQLNGDGGFSILQKDETHLIFKPVSVQALWTVIQTLHMIKERLRPSSTTRQWSYQVSSSQSCINEWHAMADLLVKRPPSPDARTNAKISSKEDAETTIKSKLRNIMKTVDLDTITSKVIRHRLEAEMGESLENYKSFIDQEILLVLGQMDPASKILEYLYLGSEWNASNLDELRQNGITHVLNVTREIDNFFPAVFEYKNIRVYDEEATDLLKHFETTYRFIREAKERGGHVLVHCKMGISRSASVVISYMMKEYEMELVQTLIRVKDRRCIVNPNKSFIKQLEVYEGILGAIRHRLTYYGRITRSKSESSLIQSSSGGSSMTSDVQSAHTDIIGGSRRHRAKRSQSSRVAENFCKSVDVKALSIAYSNLVSEDRPKSWSEEEKSEKEDCNCFGVLSQNCAELIKSEELPQQDDAKISPPSPVNSTNNAYDPDCDCNVEVELDVPEEPVKIIDTNPDEKTDILVQNLANVPLQIKNNSPASKVCSKPPIFRRSFSKMSSSSATSSLSSMSSGSSTSRVMTSLTRRSSAAGDYLRSRQLVNLVEKSARKSDPTMSASLPVMNPESCDKANDVLSVKTLANMFDFKIATSLPTYNKQSCAKLEDNKLFQKAKASNEEVNGLIIKTSNTSEC